MNAFAEHRELAVPDTGIVRIQSRELDLPLTSELLLANALNFAGRTVTIETDLFTSTLVGEGATAVWIHLVRRQAKPPGGWTHDR